MKKRAAQPGAVERRASVILRVQVGLLTATEGAAELGVSRKTYYRWEKKGLAALGQALKDGTGGRPKRPRDGEKESLRKRVEELEAREQVRSQVERIREMLKRAESSAQKK